MGTDEGSYHSLAKRGRGDAMASLLWVGSHGELSDRMECMNRQQAFSVEVNMRMDGRGQ